MLLHVHHLARGVVDLAKSTQRRRNVSPSLEWFVRQLPANHVRWERKSAILRQTGNCQSFRLWPIAVRPAARCKGGKQFILTYVPTTSANSGCYHSST